MKNQATGATEVIYEQRSTSFQHWIGLIAKILAIAVVVFGAARLGLKTETKEIITHEMAPPSGIIYMGIDKHVSDELEPIKIQASGRDVRQQTIMEDINDIKIAVKEIAENGS